MDERDTRLRVFVVEDYSGEIVKLAGVIRK